MLEQPDDSAVTEAASEIAKDIVAMAGKFNPGDTVLVNMRQDDRLKNLAGEAIADFTAQIRAFIRDIVADNPTVAELADDDRIREIAYSIRSRAETIRIEGFGTLTFAPGSSPVQGATTYSTVDVVEASEVDASAEHESKGKFGRLQQPAPAVVWFLAYVALEQYVAAELHEDPASLRPSLLAAIWTALAIVIQQAWKT